MVRRMYVTAVTNGDVRRMRSIYEKNAIFSAWLMRRIGASGSLAAVLGFLTRPLARMVDPSETSIVGSGAGAAATETSGSTTSDGAGSAVGSGACSATS